jgi:hypothetical protein
LSVSLHVPYPNRLNGSKIVNIQLDRMRREFVEALCYRPEGRGFDSRGDHWNFELT